MKHIILGIIMCLIIYTYVIRINVYTFDGGYVINEHYNYFEEKTIGIPGQINQTCGSPLNVETHRIHHPENYADEVVMFDGIYVSSQSTRVSFPRTRRKDMFTILPPILYNRLYF